MAQTVIPWTSGNGNITLTYNGQGDGTITVASDANNLEQVRSQIITVSGGGISRQVTISQAAKPAAHPNFILSDGKYLKLSDGKYFNVKESN